MVRDLNRTDFPTCNLRDQHVTMKVMLEPTGNDVVVVESRDHSEKGSISLQTWPAGSDVPVEKRIELTRDEARRFVEVVVATVIRRWCIVTEDLELILVDPESEEGDVTQTVLEELRGLKDSVGEVEQAALGLDPKGLRAAAVACGEHLPDTADGLLRLAGAVAKIQHPHFRLGKGDPP